MKRAQAFQRRLLSTLRVQGVKIKPLFAYTRTFNGFSAVLDGRDIAALERAPGSSASTRFAPCIRHRSRRSRSGADADAGWRSRLDVPGSDGSGVTVAAARHGRRPLPSRPCGQGCGRVFDLVDGDSLAVPRENPETGRLETPARGWLPLSRVRPAPGVRLVSRPAHRSCRFAFLGGSAPKTGRSRCSGVPTPCRGTRTRGRSEPERRCHRCSARCARRDRRAVRLVCGQPRGEGGRGSTIARNPGSRGRRER